MDFDLRLSLTSSAIAQPVQYVVFVQPTSLPFPLETAPIPPQRRTEHQLNHAICPRWPARALCRLMLLPYTATCIDHASCAGSTSTTGNARSPDS
ncbi:MAG: hypothetical protein QOI13_809 [Paraburkholderia sp.]|nr:hypothetical protein [Paraburkholderia sp.]